MPGSGHAIRASYVLLLSGLSGKGSLAVQWEGKQGWVRGRYGTKLEHIREIV
jgi:hypothetical protein